MRSTALNFYFDFKSPYSYLAFHRLGRLVHEHGCDLACRAVDLTQLKRLAGNTGPTTRDMPTKLRYARLDMQRWASHYGIPIKVPIGNASERLNRGTFFAERLGQKYDYVDWVWRRTWGEGREMDGDALLLEAAAAMNWRPTDLLDFVDSTEALNIYDAATTTAADLGVFGVPTIITDGEMWWGNDRLDFVAEYLSLLAGRDSS